MRRLWIMTAALGFTLSTMPAGAQVCPRGWKSAAGACVQSCPGGYEDRGQTCEYRRQGGGGGS
jgi:hypothetical protein